MFEDTNTAASPTLNVNSTGTYPIYFSINDLDIDEQVPIGKSYADSWGKGQVVALTYCDRSATPGWYINSNVPACYMVDITPTSVDFTTGTSDKSPMEIYSAML